MLKGITELVLMSVYLHARPDDAMKVHMNWLRWVLDISNGYALVFINETVILNCNMSAKSFVKSVIE